MSDFLKNRHRSWQLPDSGEKAESDTSAVESAASDSKKTADEPTFEIDFGGSEQGQPQPLTVAEPESAHLQSQDSQVQDSGPSLEIGMPGQFSVQQFDHNTRLTTETGHDTVREELAAIMMLDDPLPSSLSGSADLQDLFVAEVLRTAQSHEEPKSETVVASLSDVVAPELETPDRTKVSGALSSADQDKTQITNETLVLQSLASQSPGDEKTIPSFPTQRTPDAVPEPPPPVGPSFVPPPNPMQPPEAGSGAVAPTQAKAEQTQVGGKAKTQKSDKDEKTKSGGASKNSSGGTKVKASSTGKKNEGAADTKTQANGTNAEVVAPLTGTKTQTVGSKGWSKRERGLLAFVVVGMLLFAAALLKKMTQPSYHSQISTEIPLPSEPESRAKPKASSAKTPEKTAQKAVSAAAKNSSAGEAKVKPSASAKPALTSEEQLEEGEEEGFALETEHLLTRPVSRYAESNRSLVSLIDVNSALEKVQPRRVLALLKNLPIQFGDNDPTQKTALRELTARYYLQVGAYEKAQILFQQTCSDPSKTSDVEACLHAARGYVLIGSFDSAKEITAALAPRMTGPFAQWLEWLRLLENAILLENTSLENLLRFTDEMSDKAPFLTSEWSLQLGTFFARTFVDLKSQLRFEYLKSLSSGRKKTIEIRLSPKKYGPDIGSYMFPGFLNLMLRNHEIPLLSLPADEPDTESGMSLTSWIFHVIAQARANDLRETKARLAPLFADRAFSALGRLIEGQLAAKGGDYIGAHAMIVEQIGPALMNDVSANGARSNVLQTRQFIDAAQRLKAMPFLFVEWLFLGVKVSAGLNDRDSLRTYLVALEDARRRFPELGDELQYWQMVSRAYRVLGQVAGVEIALAQTTRLAVTAHDRGFVGADRVWLLMKKGKRSEAKALMRQMIREIPHHARLLELAAEFSASWGEEPSTYLRLEAEIPQRYHTRGRDSVLLSMFTIKKLLAFY